jgi:hypothetical protein
VVRLLICYCIKLLKDLFIYLFIFDMSAQEGGGRFELVTSASLGVVPAD